MAAYKDNLIDKRASRKATGCSSIYGGSAPATPYCRNYRSGYGPAWANSLFEDNAELSAKPTAHHGLGMATATRQMRDRVESIMKECAELSVNVLPCDCRSAEIKALFTEWIECYGCEHHLNQSNGVSNRENTLKTKEIADKLIPLMEKCGSSFSASLSETATGSFLHICKQLLVVCLPSSLRQLRHSLVKKSQWIFGRIQAPVKLGNGWAMISDSAVSTTCWPAARMSTEGHEHRRIK